MEEKKKHKVMIVIEVVLLCMIIVILGTNAASSNPPSNGVSYSKNSQTTVEGALNDLYTKANYGNASASQILSGKTALVGGKKVTGTMVNRMNTGNIAGGLNASYPNIPLNVGSNTQLATGTNGVDYIATSPPQGWYEGGGSAYTVIPKSEVISLYGITADKIVKGKTVAGVTGTGETGYSSCSSCCSTCESQDYWKVHSFNKSATVVKSYKTYGDSWVRMAHTKNTNCSGGVCGGTDSPSVFEIDLGFTPKNIKMKEVYLTPVYGDGFRVSASSGYWIIGELRDGFVVENTSNGNLTQADAVIDGSKLRFTVRVSKDGNGEADSALYAQARSFNLKGYIVYQ